MLETNAWWWREDRATTVVRGMEEWRLLVSGFGIGGGRGIDIAAIVGVVIIILVDYLCSWPLQMLGMEAARVIAAMLRANLTSSFFLHIFKVQFTEKRIQIGGKQPSSLFLASLSILLSEQVPFAEKDLAV
nr:hypothetical protein CFP56_53004 [Quercus suber]